MGLFADDVDNKETRNNGFNDILGFTYEQLGFENLIPIQKNSIRFLNHREGSYLLAP